MSRRNWTNLAIWLVLGNGQNFHIWLLWAEIVMRIYFLNELTVPDHQSFTFFTLPSMINQCKFIFTTFKWQGKSLYCILSWVFWSCESLFGLKLSTNMACNPVFSLLLLYSREFLWIYTPRISSLSATQFTVEKSDFKWITTTDKLFLWYLQLQTLHKISHWKNKFGELTGELDASNITYR